MHIIGSQEQRIKLAKYVIISVAYLRGVSLSSKETEDYLSNRDFSDPAFIARLNEATPKGVSSQSFRNFLSNVNEFDRVFLRGVSSLMQECERAGFASQHTNFLFHPKITEIYEDNKEVCQRVGIRVNNVVKNSGIKESFPRVMEGSRFYLPEVISDFRHELEDRRVGTRRPKPMDDLYDRIARGREKDQHMRQKIEDEYEKQRVIEKQREIDRRRELDKEREDNTKRKEDERATRDFALKQVPVVPESKKGTTSGRGLREFDEEETYPAIELVEDDFTTDHENFDNPSILALPKIKRSPIIHLVGNDWSDYNEGIYDEDHGLTVEFPIIPLQDSWVREELVSEVEVLNPAFGVTRPPMRKEDTLPDDDTQKPKRMLVSLDRIRDPRSARSFPVKLNGDSDLHHFTRNYAIDPVFCQGKFEQIIIEKVVPNIIALGEDRARREAAKIFASIGVVNNDNKTILHLALENKNPVMIELILDNIVNNLDSAEKDKFLNRKNPEGKSVLDMAKSSKLMAKIFNERGFEIEYMTPEAKMAELIAKEKKSYGVSSDPSHHARPGENLALKFYENRVRAVEEEAKAAAKPKVDYERMTDPVERAQSELWGSAPSSQKSHVKSPGVSPGKADGTQLARGSRGVGMVF